MKLKNILIVVKDIEKAKEYYHNLFGLDVLLDNDGNMIFTEGLVLQEEKYFREFINKDIGHKNNSCELYFEEYDIEKFVEKLLKLYPETEFVNTLMTHSWGQKVVRFYDLDGNLIEVGTPEDKWRKQEIITERLILRPWQEDDAESLYEYAKNPSVGPVAGWPVHTSVENSREIIKNILSDNETYAVCLREDNRAIGSIGLIPPAQSLTTNNENEIEVGYWIGEPFWGSGYIPEAIRALQRHAFLDLGYDAMWCGYYDGNVKSKRCQEKCGFAYHHTEENKPCELMGDVRTEHFTYLTREEWEHNVKNEDIVLR